jgi:hypothetical protein
VRGGSRSERGLALCCAGVEPRHRSAATISDHAGMWTVGVWDLNNQDFCAIHLVKGPGDAIYGARTERGGGLRRRVRRSGQVCHRV